MLGKGGAQVNERQYFKQKPTVKEVKELAARLPGGAADLISTRSRRYAALGLGERPLSEEEMIHLLTEEPGLWRRPVIIRDDQVVIGFDQKRIESLLAQ